MNNKKKIIAVIALVAALAVAFKLGGSSSKETETKTVAAPVTATTVTTVAVPETTTTTAPVVPVTTATTAPKPVVIYVPVPAKVTTTTAPKAPVVGTCFLSGYNDQLTKADCVAQGGQQWSPMANDYQGTKAGWLVTPPLTPAPTTTTTAPKVKTWVTAATFSGTGSLNGAPFTLQGGQQRITWTCNFINGHSYQSTSFNVMDDSHSGNSSIADNQCNQDPAAPGSNGSNLLYLPSGPWHFGINSTPYVTWTVKLEELR